MKHDALYTIILEKIVESLNHHLETKNDTFAKLSRVLLLKKKLAKKKCPNFHTMVSSVIFYTTNSFWDPIAPGLYSWILLLTEEPLNMLLEK